MLHFLTKTECLKRDRQAITAVIKKIRKNDKPLYWKNLKFYLANYKYHKSMKESEF